MSKKQERALVAKADLEARFPVLYKAEMIGDVLEDNYPTGLTSEDLLRVKMPTGGATEFSIEGKGKNVVDETTELEGIVCYHSPSRIYFEGDLDDPDNSGGNRPKCVSADSVTGIGSPGGSCHACPMAEWTNDGRPPPCDERYSVFLLRGENWLPIMLSLPIKSASVFEAFLSACTARCQSVYGVLVKFSLEKTTNAQGQKYAILKVESAGELGPEELKLSRGYRATMKAALEKVGAETAEAAT